MAEPTARLATVPRGTSATKGRGVEWYTTTAAGHILGVSPRIVAKWVDEGTLPGWRLPGRQDRRISRSGLCEFIRANRVPVPPCLADAAELEGYEPFEEVRPLERPEIDLNRQLAIMARLDATAGRGVAS